MRNLWMLFIVIVCVFLVLPGCTVVQPDGDEVAVVVSKPWFFGHGGVDPIPVTTGLSYYVASNEKFYYKIVPIQYKENFDDMMTDDNNPVDFDVYAELEIIGSEAPKLHEEFGSHWYENNVSPFLRKLARDKASTYKTFDLAGNREVLVRIETEIEAELKAFFEKKGLPVKVNNIVMGKVLPPPAVLEETMKTAAQIQAQKTQAARADAERARANAERQKAIADDTYRKTFGMSVPEYLHLRKLEIEKEKIELIRDKQNITVILSEGMGVPPTYPIK